MKDWPEVIKNRNVCCLKKILSATSELLIRDYLVDNITFMLKVLAMFVVRMIDEGNITEGIIIKCHY